MKIAIEFDGCVVDHRYPEIGPEVPECVDKLRSLIQHGHKIILHTMRSGKALLDARKWFQDRGIYIWAIEKDPEQQGWTSSNKCNADVYLEPRAYGAPLQMPEGFHKPCINWAFVPSGAKPTAMENDN